MKPITVFISIRQYILTSFLLFILHCSYTSRAQEMVHKTDSLSVSLAVSNLSEALSHVWWRYTLNDEKGMASSAYIDSNWKYLRIEDLDTSVFKGLAWFRLRLNNDTSLVNIPLALSFKQKGASEVYLDGKLIGRFGNINGKDSTEYFDPQNVPIIIVLDTAGEHILAIRYAQYNYLDNDIGLSIHLDKADHAIQNKRLNELVIATVLIILFVVFLTLSFLHFLFFIYYKQNVSNLYFSVFMFCIASIWLAVYWGNFTSDPFWAITLYKSIVAFTGIACVSFVFFVHIIFNKKGKLWLVLVCLLSALMFIAYFSKSSQTGYILTALLSYVSVYCFASLVKAIMLKTQGSLILGVGFGFFLVSLFAIILLSLTLGAVELNTENNILGQILVIILLLDIVSIPITMSVYQAWMFAKLNKDISAQLDQVKQLSETTIKQEKEKKQILENQNIQLESMVTERTEQLSLEKHKSDMLLLNILPEGVAEELKNTGSAKAKQYNNVSVLFTDFVNFTGLSELMSPTELVQEIHKNFTAFDAIMEKHGLEKIKTIGDAYMAVCGLPIETADHANRVVCAAIDILHYMQQSGNKFQIRIGIHSGPVVAGIVGVKKYAYDIWGDTVNTAARMEQNSEGGKINISGATFELVKGYFSFQHRGKINVKNKGEVDMYFINTNQSL